jgi:hypothetical protein
MKEKLELKFNEDGRTFLNFWDWAHGRDVVAEINDMNELVQDGTVISFEDFLLQVKQSINDRDPQYRNNRKI